MATILQAIAEFGPRLELKPTAKLEKVAEWMAMRTGLNKSEVMMVFQEESEAILNFCNDGVPVKIPGVGTFTPSMDRDGSLFINFRADMELKNGMNVPDGYSGEVKNKANIGITNERLKELWDAAHPEDPLVIE
ncbi:MAG: hypothetical protein ABTQ25_03520 [Nitrosomonas ureae]